MTMTLTQIATSGEIEINMNNICGFPIDLIIIKTINCFRTALLDDVLGPMIFSYHQVQGLLLLQLINYISLLRATGSDSGCHQLYKKDGHFLQKMRPLLYFD